MNKKEFFLGLIIGIGAAALGSYLFILLFSNYASYVTKKRRDFRYNNYTWRTINPCFVFCFFTIKKRKHCKRHCNGNTFISFHNIFVIKI
mgnify:CR=1 FL=1